MKRLPQVIKRILLATVVFLFSAQQKVYAAAIDVTTPPHRIKSVEGYVANALVAIWGLSIFYFMLSIAMIGFQYMTAFGDEQKISQAKKKGGNVVIAFVLVFGGYFFVRMIMELVLFQDPNDCFQSPLGGSDPVPIFQFFFPDVCAG